MKLIKMKNGVVNADMIESFAIVEHEITCDIVAYSLSYGRDVKCYVLGECWNKSEAWTRLEALASQLAIYKTGKFDIMHILESDNE